MRISDWSSDVCSSDLPRLARGEKGLWIRHWGDGNMVAIVSTVAYLGLEARAVEVQAQLIAGLPAFHVVGLADKAVAESRERVRGAVAAVGLALPPKRIVIDRKSTHLNYSH